MQKSIQRISALIYKELVQIVRDRRTLMLMFLLPLIQLFLFAYAVHLTVDHLPTAIYDQSLDERSRDFTQALVNSGFFDITQVVNSQDAVIAAIDSGQVKAGIIIGPDLSSAVTRGEGQVLLLLDGSDSFNVSSGYNAASQIAQNYELTLTTQALEKMGGSTASAVVSSGVGVTTSTRVLYNPEMNDLVFMLPGLIALIMQNVLLSYSGSSVVRERDSGILEQLLATPARPLERILAKLFSNALIAIIDMVLVMAFGVYWFGVPFQGSLWQFGLLSLVFILSSMGLGLLISSISRNQNQAVQYLTVFNLFSMILTGFIYPRISMPGWTQWIGNLVPLTYFLRIVRGIFTKGVGINVLWSDVASLVIYTLVVVIAAASVLKSRLD
jgi:ABC-2 type transport system permease protein